LNNLKSAFYRGLRPDPILSVAEWAEQHFRLSTKSSAEPGLFRVSRTPYLREIFDCLDIHNSSQKIVMVSGAQLGKTTLGIAWIGSIIAATPAPMLVVQSTVETATRFSKQRLTDLIDNCPALQSRIKPSRERDGGNTLLSKEFPGGILILAGANSSAGLRSMPVRFVFLDEVDSYPKDVEGEGSPLELSIARTRTFTRRKIFITSTPTIENHSVIWDEYLSSDQRQFHLPCPHCQKFQPLIWENLRYFENDPTIDPVIICQSCGAGMSEDNKLSMLAAGKWVASNPTSAIAGFHLNSLYSPWFSWREIVTLWLKAQTDTNLLKTFTNTILGLTFAESSEEVEWNDLYSRRELYPVGTVPSGVAILTAGVDVQSDRIEISVIGWGKGLEAWVIDHAIFYGDTQLPKVWEELAIYTRRVFLCADGQSMCLSKIAVDTGFATQTVYQWIRSQHSPTLMAIKGSSTLQQVVAAPSRVDVSVGGKLIKGGLKLWSVGSGHIKSWIFGKLRLEATDPYPDGFIHFPELGENYFQQLTAEVLAVTVNQRTGFKKYEWRKIRDRNETLDTFVYARAAASVLGVDRWQEGRFQVLAVRQPVAIEPIKTLPSRRIKKSPADDEQATGLESVKVTSEIVPKISAPPIAKRKKSSYWD